MNNNKSNSSHATGHLLADSPDGPVLLGSRCDDCGEYYFPLVASCTRCCGTSLSVCELGRTGHLWSWTIQCFLPKSPYNSGESEHDFQAYGVGYVQMPSGLKVESRLTCADPQRLQIGMSMQLLEIDYGQQDGRALRTYAFAPCDAEREQF